MENIYLSELLDKASKEQIKSLLLSIIKEIPNEKNKEINTLINEVLKEEIQEIDIKNLDKQIESFQEQFDLINNYELQFHSETYETGDYDYWGDDYETSYYDPKNVGSIIVNAYNLALLLVTKNNYKDAKTIFDLILFTHYSIVDDDCGDILDYDIRDIISYNLVDIDLKKVCLNVLYITLLISDNSPEEIYKYYETYIFDNIKVQDCFNINSDSLGDLAKFWDDWKKYLSKKEGEISYKLLTDALEYTNYDNYKELLKLSNKTHPELYLFVFDYLSKLNKYKEIIEIGEDTVKNIDDDIKWQISLSIAVAYKKLDINYDVSEYLYMSFEANHSVSNLIRIINNNYLEKYKNEINLIKEDPYKNNENYDILHYFLGEFDYFFSTFSNNKEFLGWSYSRMNTNVELLLFLLCNDKENSIKNKLANSICFNIRIGNDKYNLFNADDRGVDYFKILNIWKSHFDVSDTCKRKYADCLEEIVNKRVDAIVSNQYRGSYNKAAFLVCILDECLENLKIKNKGEVISFYEKKYHRYTAFRKEINYYKE